MKGTETAEGKYKCMYPVVTNISNYSETQKEALTRIIKSPNKNSFVKETLINSLQDSEKIDKECKPHYISSEEHFQKMNNHYSQKQEEIASKILESSRRSMRYLKNSEDAGNTTANELYRQRDQLINTDHSLASLNTSLKVNQRTITSIRSPFGVVKNLLSDTKEKWFGKKSKNQPGFMYNDAPKKHSIGTFESHINDNPNLRGNLRFRSKGFDGESYNCIQNSNRKAGFENQLNSNLDEINDSVARLKDLALDIGKEIEMQNEHLDGIVRKSENVVGVLQNQNKVMSKLAK